MKDKNVKSFGEFNESVFSDQGNAGMPGEMYDDKSDEKNSFTLEDMENCWRAATRKTYPSFEEWFDSKFKKKNHTDRLINFYSSHLPHLKK